MKIAVRIFNALAFVFAIFTFHNYSYAQNATSSPYSRFGIGDLNSSTFARNLSLGGTGIGLNQPGFINHTNPASYSALWYTTYEGGIDFKQYELKSDDAVHRTNNASFAYFDFAFPVKAQKWSLGFGLSPYSNAGYSITNSMILSDGVKETRSYEGSGGLNNFHIGSGFKVSRKLSLGVNAEYLFGVLNNDRIVAFESPNYFNTSIKSSTSIGWFHFKGGLQFNIDSLPLAKSDSMLMIEKQIKTLEDSLLKMIKDRSSDSAASYEQKNNIAREIAAAKSIRKNVTHRKVKSDWHLIFGLTASPSADLRARNSVLAQSFRYFSYANPELGVVEKDTIINTEGERGNVHLPVSAGVGFSLLKGNKWIFSGDYNFQQWSDFSFLGAPDSLIDSWKASLGIQYIPNDRAIKSYWNLMHYRAGFHYEQTYLKLNGENIKDIGISAGVGLPIKKAGTLLHFTFEAGKRGTMQNSLILERYLKFTFGFTINDRWFVRPKYD